MIIECPSDNLRTLAAVAGDHFSSFYRGANFDNLDLRNEDLSGLNLTGTSFAGAIYDGSTKIDERFKTILHEKGLRHPPWKYDGQHKEYFEPAAYLDLSPLEAASGAADNELAAWNAVRVHGSADALELFLHFWPGSIFVHPARQYLRLIHTHVRDRAIQQVMSGCDANGAERYDYVKTGEPPRQEDIDYETVGKLHWHNRCKPVAVELEALVKP